MPKASAEMKIVKPVFKNTLPLNRFHSAYFILSAILLVRYLHFILPNNKYTLQISILIAIEILLTYCLNV